MKRYLTVLVSLLLFHLIFSSLKAQDRPIKKYTTKNGLGHSIVYRIAQTKDGFLWFSTDNGLTRYDGATFENFTSKDGLGSNFIFGIAETDTALLVSSFGAGIVSYKSSTNIKVNHYNKDVLYPIDIVIHKDQLWVIGRNYQLYIFKNNNFEPVVLDCPLATFFKLLVTSNGELYVAASVGVLRYNELNKRFEALSGTAIQDTFYSIVEWNDNDFIVTREGGVYIFSPEDGSLTLISKGNFYNHSNSLFKDKDGSIW
ncbi:ligand-binding sensor domain-containing protein, partial [Chryseosolibacter indicus]